MLSIDYQVPLSDSLVFAIINIQSVSKQVAPLKLFWNIFTSVESFCVKFCKFHNSYPHTSTIFCRFTLIVHQIALIFPRVPSFQRVKLRVFTQKMKMQCTSFLEMTSVFTVVSCK